MKKIEFASNELKEKYKSILKKFPKLSDVMLYEFDERKIKIEEITNDIYDNNIIINDNDKIIMIVVDKLKNKIRVNDPILPYVKIYDNHSKKDIVPCAYEYEHGSRIILQKKLINFNDYGNKYSLVMKEHNFEYHISIISGTQGFNIRDFIKELLNYDEVITNIRQLLLIISKLIDLVYFDLKLSDKNGSLIKVCYNRLDYYVEYRNNGNEKQRIYLKDQEFIVEKLVKEKYEDDISPLIKKIGVYNGKKER